MDIGVAYSRTELRNSGLDNRKLHPTINCQ